jgi:predicted DNA-binding transcriptional regulator AlpA
MLRIMTHANSPDRLDPSDRSERLLPRRELRSLVPVSDMTIWRWERDGLFPRHLVINGRNYWRLSELRKWVNRQERAASACSAGGDDEL